MMPGASPAPRPLPRILAVDPGGSCGWAVGDCGAGATGLIASGTWRLDGDRSRPGLRYIRLLHECEMVLRAHPSLALVAYESAHHRGQAPTEYHYGVITHLQSWAAGNRMEVLAVHSQTLKKHATGHGNADKATMMRYAAAALHRRPETSDEADAMWLYDFARRTWRPALKA